MAADTEELYCSDDQAIQATNDDATVCKRYAVSKGYWVDEYVKYFCRTIERRSPEINRGYYARVMSVRSLLTNFLTTFACNGQIVSLGAGFDSTYWALRSLGHTPKLYVEVDYGDVTVRKCHYIKTKKDLLQVLHQQEGQVTISSNEVSSPSYQLVSCDLRHTQVLHEKLQAIGIDFSLPTFFIAECVLVYMDPNVSQQLIKWAGSNFKTAAFLNYDPIRPSDLFGNTMKKNLASLGCSLLGIEACPDLESQRSRYVNNGWSLSWSIDMMEVYDSFPKEEIARIEKLDMLDERILLEQLLQHYTLSCGINDDLNKGLRNLTVQKCI